MTVERFTKTDVAVHTVEDVSSLRTAFDNEERQTARQYKPEVVTSGTTWNAAEAARCLTTDTAYVCVPYVMHHMLHDNKLDPPPDHNVRQTYKRYAPLAQSRPEIMDRRNSFMIGTWAKFPLGRAFDEPAAMPSYTPRNSGVTDALSKYSKEFGASFNQYVCHRREAHFGGDEEEVTEHSKTQAHSRLTREPQESGTINLQRLLVRLSDFTERLPLADNRSSLPGSLQRWSQYTCSYIALGGSSNILTEWCLERTPR